MRASTLVAGLLALATAGASAQEDIPSFDSYVHDPAGVLDPQMAVPLEMMLTQIAAAGDTKIAVLTVADLGGEPVGQYALRALYEWGGGDGATKSALLLAAPDGVVAVAVGGELLSRMSDAEAQAVLIENALPSTAQFGLTTGLITGAQAIVVNLVTEEGGSAGDPFAVAGRIDETGNPVLVDAAESGSASPPGAQGTEDASFAMPNPELWINEMTTALGAAARAAADNPAAFFAQAKGEYDVLPAVLDQVSAQPTVPEQLITRFILLGISFALCVFAWRITRSSAVLLGVIGVLSGLWLWQITGFATLSLCLMLLGILFLPALKLAGVLIKAAAKRDNGSGASGSAPSGARIGIGGGHRMPGPSQSYQDWLAAQQSKPGQTPRKAVVAEVLRTKESAPAAAVKPASSGLPAGFIDNRSVPSKGAGVRVATKLAGDRERLHKAGVATPAIDQLLRSRPVLDGLNKRKLQMIAIGGFIAITVFGPVAVFALIVAAFVWGRGLWAKVKPANLSTGAFLKQVAKEAEAASRLPRS